MNELEVKRNIFLYKLFFVLIESLFVGPVLIFYIENIGKMSFSNICIMEAIVVGGLVLLEIPTGALADLIGRKKTILFGSILMVISEIILAMTNSPIDIWISNIIWMISLSLRSGATEAFLYDTLKETNRENEYEKIQGKSFGYLLFVMAFCSLSAGYLSEINPRLPFILSIPGMIIACFAVALFKEPIKTQKYSFEKQKELMKISILFVKNHIKIKWIIAFTILISVSSKIWFFTFNPYFELVDFDLKYYGIVFFFFNIISWYFSTNAHILKDKLKEKTSIISMIILIGLPILLMGSFISKAMISMTFLQHPVRGFIKPFLEGFLNRHLSTENRATVISIQSATAGLACFIGLNTFGLSLKIWTLPFCLQILGISVLLLGLILAIQYQKIFR
jgi:MFS family permease